MSKGKFGLALIIGIIITILPNSLCKKGVIKSGYYKVKSVADESVLTATYTGHPAREVITDAWKDMAVQEWRVRPVTFFGKTYYILRNDYVRSSELNKKEELVPDPTGIGEKIDLVVREWEFIPVPDTTTTFIIKNDEEKCLTNRGFQNRVDLSPCDSSSIHQKWKFDFLFPNTPKSGKNQ